MPIRDLDLDGAIRPGLDILANEIVIALKKRTRFKQNLEIYRPGIVVGHPDLSLLDYELNRVEHQHAELGRYMYAPQEAFTDVGDVKPVIQRDPPRNPIPPFDARYADRVKAFYLDWVRETCASGSDSDTFGETVTADCAALQDIYERINLGKLVAEYKVKQNPGAFRAAAHDDDALKDLIVHKQREKNVLTLAEQLSRHYDLDLAQGRKVFEWMINATIAVQIQYIRFRIQETE